MTSIPEIDPSQILRYLFIGGLTLAGLMLSVFTWITLRRVRLLNRMLHTPAAGTLTTVATLFFLGSVGTLGIMFLLWIIPFL